MTTPPRRAADRASRRPVLQNRLIRSGGPAYGSARVGGLVGIFCVGLVLIPHSAFAIIPQLVGPLQALWATLAQFVPLLAGVALGALGLSAWRGRLQQGVSRIGRRRLALGIAGVLVFAAGLVTFNVLSRPGAPRASQMAPVGTAGAVPATVPADWLTFRANAQRTGRGGGGGLPGNPGVLWRFSDPDSRLADFSSSPAVVGGRVYVGCGDANVFRRGGAIYCLEAATGRALWRTQATQQIFSSPAVADGRVYIGEGLHEDADSRLRCLAGDTGRPLWEFQTTSHVESSPTVVDGHVFFGAGEDGLYCVDAVTGEQTWHLGGYHVDASPLVSNGLVYAGSGYGREAFFAVASETGDVVWEIQTEAPVWGAACTDGSSVYFAESNVTLDRRTEKTVGRVRCVSGREGGTTWSRSFPAGISAALVVDGGDLFVAGWDGRLTVLEAETGEPRWEAVAGERLYGSPVVDRQAVVVVTESGVLVAMDRATGNKLWAVFLAPHGESGTRALASPALVDGRLYIGTSGNQFLCVGEGSL